MSKKQKKVKQISKEVPKNVVEVKPVSTFNWRHAIYNIVLLIVGVLLIKLYLGTALGQAWNNKIAGYYDEYYLMKELDLSQEKIREQRLGGSYQVCKSIEALVKNDSAFKNPVFLFPPNSYIKEVLKLPIVLPEPIVFYNYTGMKSVWLDSPDAYKATVRVDIVEGKVNFYKITSRKEIDELRKYYKDFPCTL